MKPAENGQEKNELVSVDASNKVLRPRHGEVELTVAQIAAKAKAVLAQGEQNEKQEIVQLTLDQVKKMLSEFIRNYPKPKPLEMDYMLPSALHFMQENFRGRYNFDDYLRAMKELGHKHPLQLQPERDHITQFKRRRGPTDIVSRFEAATTPAERRRAINQASDETYAIVMMQRELCEQFGTSSKTAQFFMDIERILIYKKGGNLHEIHDVDAGVIYEFDERGSNCGARRIGQPRQESKK